VKSTSGEKILGILIPLVGLRKTHSWFLIYFFLTVMEEWWGLRTHRNCNDRRTVAIAVAAVRAKDGTSTCSVISSSVTKCTHVVLKRLGLIWEQRFLALVFGKSEELRSS
jgi:hypothetical protein